MKLLALLISVLLPVAAYGGENAGSALYQKNCAKCHHEQRIGRVAPPLLPEFLRGYKDDAIAAIIRQGLPATQMPSFQDLAEDDVKSIIGYLRTPGTVKWTRADSEESLTLGAEEPGPPGFENPRNVTAVVERGNRKVWIMDSDHVIDKFEFPNVHGGLKFTYDATRIFVPSRDGWIGAYDLAGSRFVGKVRACVYLRNIAVSRDGNYLVAASWLPEGLVVIDAKTLKPVEQIDVKGKISAIYELYSSDKMVFTFKDRPLIGFLDTKTLELSYIKCAEPVEDFFIEPFERFIVGSSRRGSLLNVFDIKTGEKVFEYPVEGMPHLASASYFYKDGKFYFATSHIMEPYVTIWSMYDWGFVKKVSTGGNGFFVRTHPETPYLWTEDGTDKVVLINKTDLSVRELTPSKGKRVIHTEFSGDGRIAYVSVYDKEGSLVLYDSDTLKEIKRIPASVPVGKYNYLMKTHLFEPYFLGKEVFTAKCWGCHHPTSKAFGPSLKWIAENREKTQIRAQILDPESSYKLLGYKKNAMPRIDLTGYEIDALMDFIKMSPDM